MIYLDPVTRQRVSVQPNSGDFQYDKVGDDAISKESVEVIGPWSDDTGSDTTINSRTLQLTPSPNKFQGTDQGLQGERLGNLNSVGQSTAYIRRRTKTAYVA